MKAPLDKNEIGKFLSTVAKNAGLQQEGKKVTCQENLYFKAPRCRCSGELCGPTKCPKNMESLHLPSQLVRNTKGGCPWPSADLAALDPKMKLSQVWRMMFFK